MITLHHLENSQSLRILWLLEELEVDYEFVMYDRDPKTQLAPPEYKKLSPLKSAPVITDGNLVLSESNAIIDYILDTYGDGRLRPQPGSNDRTQYLFWFHTAQGSLQPLLTTQYLLTSMQVRSPWLIKPVIKAVVGRVEQAFIKPRMGALLNLIEADLVKHKWFAGDELTAADIVMSYSMEVAAVRAGMDQRYPKAKQFLDRIRKRPAYQRALAKDGKFKPF